MKTGLIAFRMSFVAFLVPFAFVMDPGLLFQSSLFQSVVASVGLLVSTTVWAIGIVGHGLRPLAWGDRILIMLCGIVAIVAPTASLWWLGAIGTAVGFLLLNYFWPRFTSSQLMPGHRRTGAKPLSQAGET
jgi:TRAP-type uncharacterized transport system fused permease subunit